MAIATITETKKANPKIFIGKCSVSVVCKSAVLETNVDYLPYLKKEALFYITLPLREEIIIKHCKENPDRSVI